MIEISIHTRGNVLNLKFPKNVLTAYIKLVKLEVYVFFFFMAKYGLSYLKWRVHISIEETASSRMFKIMKTEPGLLNCMSDLEDAVDSEVLNSADHQKLLRLVKKQSGLWGNPEGSN